MLGQWERAPAALVVVEGRDPGARVPAVDGKADDFEAELARVSAGKQSGADVVPGSAPAVVVGHGVTRRRPEESPTVGGRVEDEKAGVRRPWSRCVGLEKQEALVAVVEVEAGGVRREVEGEARGGGVEGSEDGVVAGWVSFVDVRRGSGFDGVEEVAKEGSGAGEAAGGDAAPEVASKGSAEEIDEGETAEDVGEDIQG
jgi:hypothetical protein